MIGLILLMLVAIRQLTGVVTNSLSTTMRCERCVPGGYLLRREVIIRHPQKLSGDFAVACRQCPRIKFSMQTPFSFHTWQISL